MIRLEDKTHKELKKLGSMEDTFDTIIGKMLQYIKEHKDDFDAFVESLEH